MREGKEGLEEQKRAGVTGRRNDEARRKRSEDEE